MRIVMQLVVVLSVGLLGCSESDKPTVVPAKGSVFFRKQPANGALVVFHPLAKGRENAEKPVATVKEDGSFVLTTYAQDDGAPEGEYGVTIVWNVKAKESKFSLGDSGGGGGGADKLGGRYGDPRNPVLKKTVKKGDPNEFRFDLE